MYSHQHFYSLLARAKSGYDKFINMRSMLEFSGLSDDQLHEIYLAVVKLYGAKVLNYIPDKMRNYDLYVAALDSGIDVLQFIKEKYPDLGLKSFEYEKFLELAVEKYPTQLKFIFQYVSPEMRTKSLWFAAVGDDVNQLSIFERSKKNAELNADDVVDIRRIAITWHGYPALMNIDPKMWSFDLCFAAVGHVKGYKPAFEKIIKNYQIIPLKPDELAVIISRAARLHVNDIPDMLHLLPPHLLTFNLCFQALQMADKKDMSVIRYFTQPEALKRLTPAEYHTLCLAALKKFGTKIYIFISPKNWSFDLCLEAVNQGKDLTWFEELSTNYDKTKLTANEYIDLCVEASKVHGFAALRYIPPEILTYDICFNAVMHDLDALSYLGKIRQNREELKHDQYQKIYLAAIDAHGSAALPFIPPDMMTYHLLTEAINKDSETLRFLYSNIGIQEKLSESEYFTICEIAKKKYDITEIFDYLPDPMKTYTVLLQAANADINVLKRLKKQQIENLTHEQYINLCLVVTKTICDNEIDLNQINDVILKFIKHYEGVRKFKKYKMDDVGTFFLSNISVIAKLYQLLDKHIFALLEKMITTSADNVSRYLSQLQLLSGQMLVSSSPKISRILDGINYKNANDKAAALMLYLHLAKEDKEIINLSLEDSATHMHAIANNMRKLLLKDLYAYLGIPYNSEEKNVMDVFSDEQFANLFSLFAEFRNEPDKENSKMFFSILKMHLLNLPFQYFHQPDEMSQAGDAYMVKIAEHNQKLRAELTANGIIVNKAFSYKKQIPLVYVDPEKEKILYILNSIFKKITAFADKNPENKTVMNFIDQIKKGKNDEPKLYRMLSNRNLVVLEEIAKLLPNIKDEYLEIKQLSINPDLLENYKPRKFHIEMWDKSKIETFFLGDYLSCCLATNGGQRTEFAPRIVDDAFLMPVIIDEATNEPVCGAWMFFGLAMELGSKKKMLDLVANFFEINAGLAENKELMNYLVVNLLAYIDQFSKSINAHEFIMRPLAYGEVRDFHNYGAFSATHHRKVEKVGGYLGNEGYFLEAVTIDKFYQYNRKLIGEEMQQFIAPEPPELETRGGTPEPEIHGEKPESETPDGIPEPKKRIATPEHEALDGVPKPTGAKEPEIASLITWGFTQPLESTTTKYTAEIPKDYTDTLKGSQQKPR